MHGYAPDTPTEPIPVYAEPIEESLPLRPALVRLAAVCAVSILSGALLVAAQDWKGVTGAEPASSRVIWWIAAGLCLAAGALSLLGLAGFALWSAVATLNRRSDERRTVLAEQARDARREECDRMRHVALGAANAAGAVQPPPPTLQLLGRETRSGYPRRGAAH
jgi:hypothetical protein